MPIEDLLTCNLALGSLCFRVNLFACLLGNQENQGKQANQENHKKVWFLLPQGGLRVYMILKTF